MIVFLLAMTMVCTGCTQKLDEPVFIEKMVCSNEMDADFSFITNNNDERSVTDIEIPNMPVGMSIQFYDELIDGFSQYDIHTVTFGIGADELDEDYSLKKDFVFHEVILKWDDGSTTKAEIGTIHMTPNHQSFALERGKSESFSADGTLTEQSMQFTAKEDMRIIDVNLPYADQLADAIMDLSINDSFAKDISKDTPLKLKAGETFELTYTMNHERSRMYGEIFLEGVITGENANGETFEDVFYIIDSRGRQTIDWIEMQIDRAD